MTVFDDQGGSINLKLNAADMLMPGSLLDETDESIADFCFVPILKHNFGPENTWFLGAPILDGYYAVFDMQQMQVGISVKNDEFADMYPWVEDPFENKHLLNDLQIVIIAVSVMLVATCLMIKCKKKREPMT